MADGFEQVHDVLDGCVLIGGGSGLFFDHFGDDFVEEDDHM